MKPTRMDKLAEKFGRGLSNRSSTSPRPGEEENVGLTTGEPSKPRRILWIVLAVCVALVICVVGIVLGVLFARWKGEEADKYVALIPFVPLPDPSVNFLVVGDWGRLGKYNQTEVATGMGVVAAQLRPDFVVSTGDNFYPQGLMNKTDPQFSRSFTQVYTDPSLNVQWYAILGEVDYLKYPDVETDLDLKNRDARWHCERNYRRKFSCCPRSHQGYCEHTVEFFFMDTSPIISTYYGDNAAQKLNFTTTKGMPSFQEAVNYALNMMRDGLESSDATWKIVVGHHPVYSTGEYGGTPDLENYLAIWFKKLGVDMFINGHDNNLELIQGPEMDTFFVTSGAGSLTSTKRTDYNPGQSLFYSTQPGFVSGSISGPTMDLRFYSADATLLYNVTLGKV